MPSRGRSRMPSARRRGSPARSASRRTSSSRRSPPSSTSRTVSTLLRPGDIERRIWPLPARRINGIGPKSSAKLEALGVRTIADLAAADPAWLVEHFGRAHGAFMHDCRARPRRARRRHRDGAEVDQPRDDVRARSVGAARPRGAVADLHRAVRGRERRPAAQGLRRQDDRLEAPLRQLQDGDARPHARLADRRSRVPSGGRRANA